MRDPTAEQSPDFPIPCVLYAAKSTADPRGSIATQLSDARAMAEREGWEVVAECQDEGFSAFKGNRGPGLDQAKRAAAQAAEEHGAAVLLAQHSDRLARGAGDAPGAADHLVEVVAPLRRCGVQVRTVLDDFFKDPRVGLMMAAVQGQRNAEDSDRKSGAVADGLRRVAARGEWPGGVLADGYLVIHWHEAGRERRRVEFDPDRKSIYDLIWDLARQGYSTNAITAELDRRTYRTQPRKNEHRPRPFDSNRIRQTLDNPFYAGLSVHRGQVVGEGQWPHYVTPEDFYRLREERRARSHAGNRRRPGRPPEGYMLSGIGECTECGSRMDCVTGSPRKDGSRPRRYVCRTHRERPGACTGGGGPFDAALVDPAVLDNLQSILGDLGAIRAGVAVARAADLARLEDEARAAREDVRQATKGANRIAARIAALYAAGQDEKAIAMEDALARSRADGAAAETRLSASLDAIQAMRGEEPGEDAHATFWERLRADLSERAESARGDVKRLNLALADFLEAVVLIMTKEGAIRLLPRLSAEAVSRILRDTERWPHGVTAEVAGVPAEVVGIDGHAIEGARVRLAVSVPADEAEEFARRALAGRATVDVSGPPAFEATVGNPHPPW